MTINEENRFLPGDLIAVGDIHGRYDLLDKLTGVVADSGVHLLFLGDLIDRAKAPEDDLSVLSTVQWMADRPEDWGLASVGCLRGNHEDMLLKALRDQSPWGSDIDLWRCNGGAIEAIDQLRQFEAWIRSFPLFRKVGSTVFVHGGLEPGVPLSQQNPDEMVWIRNRFLNADKLGVRGVKCVVHGHTPNFCGGVVVKHNRIGLDSGAYFTGKLSCYNHRSGEVFQVTE
jgi:serine/threonine protein phosphatase 1